MKMMLASASPRRTEILERMGIPHSTHPQNVDETFLNKSPKMEAERIARLKIEALMAEDPQSSEQWALGADTFIAMGYHLIGKPKDRNDAAKMLRKMAGRRHKVITGMALNIPGRGIETWTVTTFVVFDQLSSLDIEWYLKTNEWKDAAGAYKIQGAGSCLIKKIIGSYPNVMGLPSESLYGILRRYKFPLD